MPETIGQRLKKAREYRNLTLEKVEEVTRIRAQYLQALEADDFSALPSPIQARGFLRNYAQYLELDLDQMVDELRATRPEPETEPEVVFEGERQTVLPEAELTEPEAEEKTAASEPFWQTWLRRVRKESGQREEEVASQSTSEAASVLEPEPSPKMDIASGGDVAQNIRDEASEESADAEGRPKSLESLLGWANIRISHKQADVSPEPEKVEEEAEPEPEPEAQSESSAKPALSSQEIINNIGLQLRQRREMLSLTLEEIERHTRMRAQFMESLEKGNFDELPSPVQTRGMLSNYASFLDLDVDDLLLQFAEALQARHRERHPEKAGRHRRQPDVPARVPTLRSFIASDLVFGVGIVLLLVVFSIWGISRVIALQSEQQAEVEAEATGPSISEALIGTPVETLVSEVTLIPAEDTPIPDLPEGTVDIPTPAFNVNVQVNIIAVERTFLRVVVDGEEVFNGRTIPGNAYPFEAGQSVEILAGSGAALRAIYNQRDLGLLGGFGQVASFIYTADEILVPTPVIPPTPTNTPYLSPTPSVTPSPTFTSTPTALSDEGLR
jgi:cytoskeletal protein RodZ